MPMPLPKSSCAFDRAGKAIRFMDERAVDGPWTPSDLGIVLMAAESATFQTTTRRCRLIEKPSRSIGNR